MARYHGNPRSAAVLVDGLPMEEGRLPLALVSRAAARANLSAKLVNQQITAISDMLMPCILILKEERAVVLLEVDNDAGKARIHQPEADGDELVDIESLTERHDGRVVYLKQEHRFDERAPETLKQSDGHWFWSTLKLSRPIYRDVILASILINLFAVASPLFVMNAYDKVVPNLAFNTLWVLATGMAIIMVFDFVMRQTRAYFMDTAGKKSEVLLTSKLFSKTMNLRMEARPGSVGGYVKHLQEFDSIREFFTSATLRVIVNFCVWPVRRQPCLTDRPRVRRP